MNDKTTIRARRLQETLDIPYARARDLAASIEQAAETQVVWPKGMPPIYPVGEKDLALVSILGSAWTLQVYDMEQPYRVLSCSYARIDEFTQQTLIVSLDYAHGAKSYDEAPEMSLVIDPQGEPNIVATISTDGHPHQVADRISKALLSQEDLNERSLAWKLIEDWPASS